MHVVNNNQPRIPNNQNPQQIPLSRPQIFPKSINPVKENEIGDYNGESVEDEERRGGIIEALVEVYDGGVYKGGEEREEVLEVGEEGRVVEGPWACHVGVPVGEREGVGEGEPVTVDLEVCAVVGWDEEELDAGGHSKVPGEIRDRGGFGWGRDLVFWGCHG